MTFAKKTESRKLASRAAQSSSASPAARVPAGKQRGSRYILTVRQARNVRCCIADYQEHLESAIEGLTVPGTNQGMNEADNLTLAELRLQWRMAENIQLLLEPKRRPR